MCVQINTCARARTFSVWSHSLSLLTLLELTENLLQTEKTYVHMTRLEKPTIVPQRSSKNNFTKDRNKKEWKQKHLKKQGQKGKRSKQSYLEGGCHEIALSVFYHLRLLRLPSGLVHGRCSLGLILQGSFWFI